MDLETLQTSEQEDLWHIHYSHLISSEITKSIKILVKPLANIATAHFEAQKRFIGVHYYAYLRGCQSTQQLSMLLEESLN
jgi:hypothetical protein